MVKGVRPTSVNDKHDKSTPPVEERIIILFAGPLIRANNNVTEERVNTTSEPTTATTLATTERTTEHRSKRIQRKYRKRRHLETRGEDESLLPFIVRTQLTKIIRRTPLSIVRTTNYQCGVVMKVKRREDKPDSNNLARNESFQSKTA